jgi:DNA sulfur modification protein DndD
MEIKLLGWTCEGFRCPDMEVDLRKGSAVPRVALVQMPNGTGKTTTLVLLKGTLTGEARNWTSKYIAGLRSTNKPDSGAFSVSLTVDGRPLKLEMTCDFELGEVSFNTTSPEVGGFNRGWTPPPAVRRFLAPRFVDLFVFDGELANTLLDPHATKAEEAIETLCQLDLLDSLANDCEQFWRLNTAKAGARHQTGLARYTTIAGRLNERIQILRKNIDQRETKLGQVNAEVERLNTEIQKLVDQDGKNRETYYQKKASKAEAEQALSGAVRELMDKMRRPESLAPAFGQALKTLKANLDVAKLPDSTSRQFFQELALKPECICGRPVGEKERLHILSSAEDFLGEELAGVLNAFKQEVDIIDSDERQKVLDALLTAIEQIRLRIADLEAEMAVLEKSSVSAAGGDPEEFRRQLEPLNVEKANLERELDLLRAPIEPGESSELITSPTDAIKITKLAVAEKQLRMANDEINRINGTLELRMRLDLLKQVCTDARGLAKQRIKDGLLDKCNQRLRRILKGDPLEIQRIDRSLVLKDRESGSAGQNLAVGYTFLAEALSKGSHDFPLVVDSPAGPLDHGVRRQIATMVPALCTQFVAFTISTEREAFLEPLEASAGGDVKYITVFRNTPGNASLLNDLPADHTDNGQSFVVGGRDYFVRFALENENDEAGSS